MGKQAIGMPGINYMFNTKGTIHVMNYPQKPLCSSKASKIIGFDTLPSGQNACVAVMPFYGNNQEDSLVMNQDSIDRGFMCTTTYKCYEATIKADKNERFEIPEKGACNNYKGNMAKLDPITCIIPEGQTVNIGDALIGKTVEINGASTIYRHNKINASVLYDHPWPGKVYAIQRGYNGDGYEYVRVVIAQPRSPVNGDKFAARHGQKGTIGMTYRSYDMPFTLDGMAPDILINPLAFPSRMTIGMLIEMISGVAIASSSVLNEISVLAPFRFDHDTSQIQKDMEPMIKKYTYSSTKNKNDATPYNKAFSWTDVCEELKALGYNEFSDRKMINGQTGELIPCLIFNGVCYYQRLRHMVIDKIHVRSRGGTCGLTRQPYEGRSKGGGLRFGCMERDCISALGLSGFLKDRMVEQSDETEVGFCKICGLIAIVIKEDVDAGIPERRECRLCQTNQVGMVKFPYATKLMIQEFAGMNVIIRILPTPYDEEKFDVHINDKLYGTGKYSR
jgi:DNA-directed RNA polymerase II subunit RPB2